MTAEIKPYAPTLGQSVLRLFSKESNNAFERSVRIIVCIALSIIFSPLVVLVGLLIHGSRVKKRLETAVQHLKTSQDAFHSKDCNKCRKAYNLLENELQRLHREYSGRAMTVRLDQFLHSTDDTDA